MARSFTQSSSMRLSASSALVTDVPLTMAAWIYPLDSSVQTVCSTVKSTDADVFFRIVLVSGKVRANCGYTAAGGQANAITTASHSTNAWDHVCAVFSATNSRTIYLNGGNAVTNTTALTSGPVTNETHVGSCRTTGLSFFQFMNGYVAEFALWSVALTAAEVASLYVGVTPSQIRASSLETYCPMVNSGGSANAENDIVGGLSLAATNSPTVVAHPRIIMPHRRGIRRFTTAVSSGGFQSRRYYDSFIGGAHV